MGLGHDGLAQAEPGRAGALAQEGGAIDEGSGHGADVAAAAGRSKPAWRRGVAEAAATLRRAAVGVVYPPVCVACGAMAESPNGLCGPCWRDASFLLGGLVCDLCGAPLPGEAGAIVQCDDCLRVPRPWSRGRAVLPYRATGRDLVLAFKHADRTDLARPLGAWLARAARPLLDGDPVLVPVPLHWRRLLARRYNQAALLARAVGRELGLPVLPDALVRRVRTGPLGHLPAEERHRRLADAIAPHRRRGRALAGRDVLVVDDVMTSGATLAACTEAAHAAGATEVRVIVLARALLEP